MRYDKNNKKLKRNNFPFWIFISFILFFPPLIKGIQYFINNGWKIPSNPLKPIINVVVQNFSFYATALSITFTVYVFVQNEKQRDKEEKEKEEQRYKEEREKEEQRYKEEKEKEEQRYREEQEKREQLLQKETKEKEKIIEIRKKELESRKDYFRPTFILEKNELSNYYFVKLLMQNENSYIENVTFYSSTDTLISTKAISVKSGDVVAITETGLFYITARTQIGENILFGYLNGGIKIHKFLKEDGNPLYPRNSFQGYNQKEVDKNWGNYNIVKGDTNNLLDQVFFYDTIDIREKMIFNFTNAIERTLKSKTATELFKLVFKDITNEINSDLFTIKSIIEVVKYLLGIIESNFDLFTLQNTNNLKIEYLRKQIGIINKSLVFDFCFNENFREDTLNNLIKKIRECLCLMECWDDSSDTKILLRSFLTILFEIFMYVKVDETLDNQLIVYKSQIYNNLKTKSQYI